MNPVAKNATRAWTAANVWMYRRTNGRVGGRGMGRVPLLLLSVPGRKTGTMRTVPVAYFDHDDGYLVTGTGMGGSRRTPQWCLNLQAAGRGHVRIGARGLDADAHLATGSERDELWPQIAARAPHFAKWQARTGRTLPVIVLTPKSHDTG
jgi:deazaflavin-dependent oxidoreductase (nitroreductase family)